MKVLFLTSPPARHLKLTYHEKKMHIGIIYLIGVLELERHAVDFIDLYLMEEELPNVMNYNFVGIHSSTITFNSTLKILDEIYRLRKRGWNGKIIVGGPHASIMPESIPDFVDYIVIGEGEYAVRDIINGKNLERVICYPRIENLDKLPRAAYHHYRNIPYSQWDTHMLGVEPIANMNTSRGCPFSCTFCSVNAIWGKKYTYHRAERIIDDIQYLMKTFNVRGVFFREDNFTMNKKRVIEFCTLLIKKKIKIKWMCETRADSLTEDLLKLMYRSGCRCIYIGVEAATERMLRILNKKISLDQVRKVAKWCHFLGLKFHVSFITNVPHETEEDKSAIFKLVREIKPHSFKINKYRGYPGSPLYNYIIENNLYREISNEGLLDISSW